MSNCTLPQSVFGIKNKLNKKLSANDNNSIHYLCLTSSDPIIKIKVWYFVKKYLNSYFDRKGN